MDVRRRSIRLLGLLVAAAATALVLSPPGLAARKAPQGFYGVAFDADVLKVDDAALDQQWGLMAVSGVESARLVFNWGLAQHKQGGPIDFSTTDKWVTLGASHGIEILPVVLTAPSWARIDSARGGSPPKKVSDYTNYLRALVRRYGPNGSFWSLHPELPKRPLGQWVIWNEPHLFDYWSAPNWERGYGALLRASYKTLKAEDPHAKVVVAGITGASWEILARLYNRTKLHGFFDAVAIHPYTKFPSGLPKIIRRVRETMAAHGDGKKELYVTEFGWSASKGIKQAPKSISGIQVTDQGMAKNAAAAYDALIKARRDPKTRISRAYWYTWASIYQREESVFTFSGLERFDGTNFQEKPALAAYKASARRNEGCAKTTAGVCGP